MGFRAGTLLLLLVGIAAYQNSFSAPLIWDDESAIVDNSSIRSLSSPWDVLRPPRETSAVAGRPIANLSFAVNYAIDGPRPEGYHVVNLALHLLSAFTLYGIVRRTCLLPRWSLATRTAAPWLALSVALIWEAHPLLTEAVTYVSQRTELLMGLFLLLTLYGAIRAATAPVPMYWNAAAIVSCGLGMGSKEVMAAAPLLVVLYDRLFLFSSSRQMLGHRRSLYLGLAMTWLVLGALAVSAPHGQLAGFGVIGSEMTPWRYGFTQCGVITHYLRLVIWPHPLILDYGDWHIAQQFGNLRFPAMLVAALAASTVWALRHRSWTGFLGAWFLLILAPTSSFMPIPTEVAAERRMYLPLIACVVILVVGGWRLLHHLSLRQIVRRLLAGSAVTLIAALLLMLTIQRNAVYRSAVSIWSDAVAQRPLNARAHHNLGTALMNEDRLDEATQQFATALALAPRTTLTHSSFADALMRQGRLEEALNHATEAVRLNSDYAPFHQVLADLLVRQGQGAVDQIYRQGDWLYRQGRTAEAITYYMAALRLRPDSADIHNSLAVVLMGAGLVEEAEAHQHLADSLRRQGQGPE